MDFRLCVGEYDTIVGWGGLGFFLLSSFWRLGLVSFFQLFCVGDVWHSIVLSVFLWVSGIAFNRMPKKVAKLLLNTTKLLISHDCLLSTIDKNLQEAAHDFLQIL